MSSTPMRDALYLREISAGRPALTTQMKSVGGAMAIGRTCNESLQKCLRLLPERGCGKTQLQHVRKPTPQNISNLLLLSTR